MDWKIPLFKIYWDDNDLDVVRETIQRGMSWAIGPNIQKFEQMLAEYVGTKYALAFSSGTSALHALLLAYGVGQGDEVIVPSFTFIATANAPLFVGAKPVFADIEDKTYGLDPRDIANKITPRTKAIIPIHYGGCPCLVTELSKLAERHDLILIEDAAEALGATVDGKKAGSLGDAAILSFCSNKVITTGEGGAVTTNSEEIYSKLKLIRSHGRVEKTDYFSSIDRMDYVALGYNFRMSDITAALGISQLAKIGRIIDMRRQNVQAMSDGLAHLPEIEVPQPPPGFSHVDQMYTIRVKGGREVRDALMKYLAQQDIMTKVYFYPAHLTDFYRNELGYNCQLPVTERLSSEVLTLPLYPTLTTEEIDYIVSKITAFFDRVRNKGK